MNLISFERCILISANSLVCKANWDISYFNTLKKSRSPTNSSRSLFTIDYINKYMVKPNAINIPKRPQKEINSSQNVGENRSKFPKNVSKLRSGSGISPRKVSEGLKQLPASAYQFVRESYLMLDSDGQGSVSREVLKQMLKSIGMHEVGETTLDKMLERTGEPITFAGYLAVMGDLLAELPAQKDLDLMVSAFKEKDGSFDEISMCDALENEGLSKDEIKVVLKMFSTPSKTGDTFDDRGFVSTMST